MARLPASEVYRVGGSVRDELLERPVKDADYVVCGIELDDLAVALEALGAAKTSPLQLREGGPQVGVRADIGGGLVVDVCLPRRERSMGPGRHAFEMQVSSTLGLVADAGRRDFTINALYRDVRTRHLRDPLATGRSDLEQGLIRTTRWESFEEDPLRTLRALRFVSTLGFDLSPRAYEEMVTHAHAVTGLTRKGVSSTALDELSRMLSGDYPSNALRLARDTGVLVVLLPELREMIGFDQASRYHTRTVDEHTFEAIQRAAEQSASLRVRLALLFHDAGKPGVAWEGEGGHKHYYARSPDDLSHEQLGARLAEAALERLNASRRLRNDVQQLIERHMLPLDSVRAIKVHEWRSELDDPLLADLILHRRCDALAKGGDPSEDLAKLQQIEARQTEAILRDVPRAVEELAIDGHDLLELGLRGRKVGYVQAQLLHEVMSQPALNRRPWLLSRAARLAAEV